MSEMKYPVTELFHSVQGEGANVGRSAIFLRLAGCNLACVMTIDGKEYPCDEPLHDDPNAKNMMTVSEIMEQINSFGPAEIVVITGGEPTLYNLKPITDMLNDPDKLEWFHAVEKIHPIRGAMPVKGFRGTILGEMARGPLICIETNGTNPIQGDIDFISLSPKPPRFGKNQKHVQLLENVIERAGEIRFVLGWDTPAEIQDMIHACWNMTNAQLYISPLTQFPGNTLIQETADQAIQLVKANARYGVRLNLQTHKWVGVR